MTRSSRILDASFRLGLALAMLGCQGGVGAGTGDGGGAGQSKAPDAVPDNAPPSAAPLEADTRPDAPFVNARSDRPPFKAPPGKGWIRIFDSTTDGLSPYPYGFNGGAWDEVGQKWYSNDPNGNGHVFIYDPATNRFERLAGTGDTMGAGAHNCSSAFDPVNEILYFSACTPQPNHGAHYWSKRTNTWTRYSAGWARCGSDPVMVYAPRQRAVYCTGGWSNADTVNRTFKLDVATPPVDLSAWKHVADGGPVLFPAEALRESNTRGGWDNTRMVMWVIDGKGDFWTFDPAKDPSLGWTRKVTTGAKPREETVFAQRGTEVIGFAGQAQQDPSIVWRETFILDTTTGVWTLGPVGDGQTPPAGTYPAIIALGDSQATFMITTTGVLQLWRYR